MNLNAQVNPVQQLTPIEPNAFTLASLNKRPIRMFHGSWHTAGRVANNPLSARDEGAPPMPGDGVRADGVA